MSACDAVVALSANDAVTVGAKPLALVATEAVTSIVSGKPTVTFTSLPTFVTAVSTSLAVPIICKSSSVNDTFSVPVSPSTVKLVAIPVKFEPSPSNEPLNDPLILSELTSSAVTVPVVVKLPV